MSRRSLPLVLLLLGSAGCRHNGTSADPEAPIRHVVLLGLRDPADAEALVRDCAMLAKIPSVRAFACGRPYRSRRADVVADYDVAIILGFEDEAGYAAYEAHPIHQELVRSWQPRLSALKVHDVDVRTRPEAMAGPDAGGDEVDGRGAGAWIPTSASAADRAARAAPPAARSPPTPP